MLIYMQVRHMHKNLWVTRHEPSLYSIYIIINYYYYNYYYLLLFIIIILDIIKYICYIYYI